MNLTRSVSAVALYVSVFLLFKATWRKSKSTKRFRVVEQQLVAVQFFGSCCLPAMLDFITPQNAYFPFLTVHTFPGHNSTGLQFFYKVFLQLVQFRHTHSTRHLKRDVDNRIFSHFQDNLTILASLIYQVRLIWTKLLYLSERKQLVPGTRGTKIPEFCLRSLKFVYSSHVLTRFFNPEMKLWLRLAC